MIVSVEIVADEAVTPPRAHRHRWWKEAAIVIAFYTVYSMVRNQFGSQRLAADGVPEAAFNNAMRVIRWEKSLGLYREEAIQDWFLQAPVWMIRFWNGFYGTAHFVVTIAVFVVLYRKRPDVFALWRNTLAIMTALALVGFSFFPLMPPRLLDEPCPPAGFGGACISTPLRGADGDNELQSFGFVDTLAERGGLWNFDSGGMASISNQYAAMPSLHIGWATWCAFAMWPLLRRRRTRAAVLLYPLATLWCIVVTANHFWLDGVGGQIVFMLGFLGGWGLHEMNQRRLDRRHLSRVLGDLAT
jgi:hypothetical protein